MSTCGIYEVCRKSNGTGVTNNLFQFQTTKLHGFPFKVISLESNALFHPSLPRFYSLLEGFFWDAPQLRRYGRFDGLHAFKTGPLMIPLSLGKEKSHTEQDQVNREVVPVRRCSSRPGTAGCSGR